MDGRMRWTDIARYFYKKWTGKLHPRIKFKLYFEVDVAIYHDCPIYDDLRDAESQATYEDEIARKYLDENGFPLKWREEVKKDG